MPVQDITTAVQSIRQNGELLIWFEIDSTVSVVAFSLGLLIFVIAYFAGGRENRNKLWISVLLSIIIAILSMPLFINLGKSLGIMHKKWGEITILFLLMIFIAGLAAHIYEIITVSAREARPPD